MGKHCWPGGLEVPVEPDAGAGYRLAAIWSFYLPYAPRLQQPGYNVLARVPFSEFESMSLVWGTLGCEKLDLLNRTDCGWMREASDEPPNHTTANLKYRDVWDRYEDVLIEDLRSNR